MIYIDLISFDVLIFIYLGEIEKAFFVVVSLSVNSTTFIKNYHFVSLYISYITLYYFFLLSVIDEIERIQSTAQS